MDKAGTVAFEDFYSAFSGAKVDLLELLESGDKLAARLLIKGRHTGEFMGVPPSGNDVLAITTIPDHARRQVHRALVDRGHVRPDDRSGGSAAGLRQRQRSGRSG